MNSTYKSSICLLYNLFKNDQRTVLCKNLNTIADDCNVLVDNLSKKFVKTKFNVFKVVMDNQNWKIPLIYELLDLILNNFSRIKKN